MVGEDLNGQVYHLPQKSGDCKPVVQPLPANALWTVKRNPPQIKYVKDEG